MPCPPVAISHLLNSARTQGHSFQKPHVSPRLLRADSGAPHLPKTDRWASAANIVSHRAYADKHLPLVLDDKLPARHQCQFGRTRARWCNREGSRELTLLASRVLCSTGIDRGRTPNLSSYRTQHAPSARFLRDGRPERGHLLPRTGRQCNRRRLSIQRRSQLEPARVQVADPPPVSRRVWRSTNQRARCYLARRWLVQSRHNRSPSPDFGVGSRVRGTDPCFATLLALYPDVMHGWTCAKPEDWTSAPSSALPNAAASPGAWVPHAITSMSTRQAQDEASCGAVCIADPVARALPH